MIILCADDYAMTEGVSRAVGELAAARRLSATSVIVTSRHWPGTAPRLLVHRTHLSIGLHLNLTLGSPLGPMLRLAPNGQFPAASGIVAWALLGMLDAGEIRDEIGRQLDRFEAGVGFPPDHIDGHQHVHVLPSVRTALLETVSRRYPKRAPLIRDPSDRLGSILARQSAVTKAIAVAVLATGFHGAVRSHGLRTNDSFAGFSDFNVDQPYGEELERAMQRAGPRHMVMCHPGHPDAELAGLDPVVARRRMEYDALMGNPSLMGRIWRPSRRADGPPFDWSLPEPQA
ncbi:MAG: ChbG/HpnK family deacetylase [Hyphomicrobiaceae bacterium]|nr:MAG: ChbG/HpnK family deacetylase [Hyphomicrobiaceae bacterium]